MTKLYTKKGDKGTTRAASGERLHKCDNLCHAQGDIDELNCQLGVIISLLDNETLHPYREELMSQQHILFTIGSLISLGTKKAPPNYPSLSISDVTSLENHIDEWTEHLPPLKHFILPGGSYLITQIHLARAICRRAERQVSALETSDPILQVYINRLSDWLFTLARVIAQETDVVEIKWQAR